MGAYTRETSPRKLYRRCGSERADKRRKQARRSFSTEDCQNSRSLCRFYSRSTRYEREIQPLPEQSLHASSPLSLFLFLRSDEFFEKLRARTTDNRRRSLREGRLRPLKHMASKRAEEKDFYPTGGPRGFSTARRAASSASSVRLPGPGTMENVYHGSRLEQYT